MFENKIEEQERQILLAYVNALWSYGSSPVKTIIYVYNKGNNKITELRTILQRECQNS
jgi:hypothetical protein